MMLVPLALSSAQSRQWKDSHRLQWALEGSRVQLSLPRCGGKCLRTKREDITHTLNTTVQSCANPDTYTKGACRLYPHTAGQFYPHTYPHLLFIGHIYCARSGCVTCAWIAARDRRAFQAQAGPKEEHLTKGMLVLRILSLDLLMSLLYFSKENIPSFLPHGFDPKPIVVGGSLSRDCNQLWMTPLSRTVMFFQLFNGSLHYSESQVCLFSV